MIRQLKRFVDWLDRRWPPKVRVTEESFAALSTDIKKIAWLEKKVYELTDEVTSLKDRASKDALGRIGTRF